MLAILSCGVQMRTYTYRALLVLVTLATTNAWVLQINVDYVTPHKTNNVQLVCKQDDILKTGQGLQTINGIRITKLDPFGEKSKFAEMHVISKKAWSRDPDVDVSASLNQADGGAYLSVTWPVANEETEGAYGCEILGYNALDNQVTVNVRPSVRIRRKMLSEDDVMKLIRKMTQGHVKKQEDLEQEIVSLKRFINENLQSTRQQITNIDDEIKGKLINLQNTIESTCSTKSELKDQVSDLKDFTINRILTVKNNNQRELDKLSSLLQNTSSTFEREISGMAQNLSNFKDEFTSNVDSLSKTGKDLSSHFNSTSSVLTKQIHSVDTKYGNAVRKLSSSLTRKISELERKCSCTTTPAPTTAKTTTPKTTPKPVIGQEWPEGNYALARPATGCPNSHVLKSMGRHYFKTLPYTSTGFSKGVKDADKKRYTKLLIGSHSSKTDLKYCVKDASTPSQSSQPWPKGTYCITLTGGSCGSGFENRQIYYFFNKGTGSTSLGWYTMQRCCRADQKANIPMKLPIADPFYLFRYNGNCQSVQGMTVTDHVLDVKVSARGLKALLSPIGQVDSTWQKMTIYMCYYQPS